MKKSSDKSTIGKGANASRDADSKPTAPTARKATSKKATSKKAAAKKAAARKAPAKKTTAKKAPAKKAPVKKAPARKATFKKAPKAVPAATITAGARWRMVSEAAYLLAEKRNFRSGGETADWLRAEAQVDAQLRQEGIKVVS